MPALNPTKRAVARAVTDWNTAHGVGTIVNYRHDNGTHTLHRTKSTARVTVQHLAVIELTTLHVPANLFDVTAVRDQENPRP